MFPILSIVTLAQTVAPLPPAPVLSPPMVRPAPSSAPAQTAPPGPAAPVPAPLPPSAPAAAEIQPVAPRPAAPSPIQSSPPPAGRSAPAAPQPAPKLIPPRQVLAEQERIAPQEGLPPVERFRPQEVRPLPGKLDEVPVFNSNSPEIVQTEGVLLSTFPPDGMQVRSAHLNFPFQGRFDFFSHHIARAKVASEARTLFQGVILANPSAVPITVEVLQGASYLTRPDALFVELPHSVDDPIGKVHAGPGSRAVNDVLRGRRQGIWALALQIPPGESRMLMNLPIPVGTVLPSSNGRSTLFRMRSNGPVYIANLAMFAPLNPDNTERIPTQAEWEALLVKSGVSGPRDIPPTPLQDLASYSRVVYGRVAGVAVGSQWQTSLTDTPQSSDLTIPRRGYAISYGLSTLYRGSFGTGQIQSAKILTRYLDTAHLANGNYGIEYNLSLPLHNATRQPQTVTIALQTPLKDDKKKGGLLFLRPLGNPVFFRGPVRVKYTDDRGTSQVRFVHLTQQRGQEGEPLVTLNLPPGDRRAVQVNFLYPPDSTPPQVLTVRTIDPTEQP
jgi:Protein of unknown function (DUF3370)